MDFEKGIIYKSEQGIVALSQVCDKASISVSCLSSNVIGSILVGRCMVNLDYHFHVGKFTIWSDNVCGQLCCSVCLRGTRESHMNGKKSECVVCRHPVTYKQVSGSYMC